MTEISMQKAVQTLVKQLKCHVSTHLSSTKSQPFQVQRYQRLFITVADNVRDDKKVICVDIILITFMKSPQQSIFKPAIFKIAGQKFKFFCKSTLVLGLYIIMLHYKDTLLKPLLRYKCIGKNKMPARRKASRVQGH